MRSMLYIYSLLFIPWGCYLYVLFCYFSNFSRLLDILNFVKFIKIKVKYMYYFEGPI